MATLMKEDGGLDILVNNAGINLRDRVENLEDEVWQRMLDTNLTSVFRVSRAALPCCAPGRGQGGESLFAHV